MLIYVEKKAENYELTKRILAKFSNEQILWIDHYKNIFDKKIGNQKLTPAIIIAKEEHPNLLPVPNNYWYPGKSFFFRTSLNCVFDCEYCYLKGNFKTQYPVIFVNYEDIQESISQKINEIRKDWYNWQITLYASNYSDIQGLDAFSEFNENFIPFVENFDNVLMETRTKSSNIDSLLKINNWIPYKNTEISFSLNPEEIISTFEKKTAPLQARITAINTLLTKGYKVWLRFLPLLPIDNYEIIYKKFLEDLKGQININKINSIFIASLIYNQWDFKTMQKKNPDSKLWDFVKLHENWLVKLPDNIFQNFSNLFKEEFPNKEIYYDFI